MKKRFNNHFLPRLQPLRARILYVQQIMKYEAIDMSLVKGSFSDASDVDEKYPLQKRTISGNLALVCDPEFRNGKHSDFIKFFSSSESFPV